MRERIAALDILRGVAVAGILFGNVLTFFGLFVLPDVRAAALPTVAADKVAVFLEHERTTAFDFGFVRSTARIVLMG